MDEREKLLRELMTKKEFAEDYIRLKEEEQALSFELGEAFKKVIALMKQEETQILIIERKYMLEIFDKKLLEINQDDGLPKLKSIVVHYLANHEINILYDNSPLIKFVKKGEEGGMSLD